MTSLPPQRGGQVQGRRVWVKRATIALPLLCLVIFGAVIGVRLTNGAQSASAASFALIKGQVPALVTKSTLVGSTDSSQSLSITIGLQLRNADNLKSYIDGMTRHKSLTAHQHLTSSQIVNGYAPLASSQQSVIDYLKSFGFQVTSTDKFHLTIGFQGTVGDAENAFHIQINNYRSSKGQNFYAPATDPSVPTELAGLIQNVAGLDNATQLSHPPISQPKNAAANVLKANATCIAQGTGYFIPSQIATAYNLNSFYSHGFKGEGQSVALLELDNYNSSDITNYKNCYGGASVPINRINVDNGPGNPSIGAVEVELDMELILSSAPHLAALNVYEAPNTWAHYMNLWSKIISDDTSSVISTSWGACEAGVPSATLTAENNLFMIAAAQGQSIFAASGDSGTNDCGLGTAAVDDPASQPYVTGVGGTALSLNGDNTYASESVWNDAFGASGGGISNLWPMPGWQAGTGVNNTYTSGTPCAAASGNCREVPDVALDADPNTGYVIYCSVSASCGSGATWLIAGGTSAAAPMWAAFMALTNQKTLHDGGFNIGFINPLLYQVDQNASGTSYANDFNDVTTGNNDGLGNGLYPATTAYDMATGLGSYNAWNLAGDLESLANSKNGSRGAPANTTWYFAEGSVGGSFQEYISILNPSATQTANVTIQYLFQNQSVVTVQHTVAPSTPISVNVNTDLGISVSGGHQSISAIVTSDIPVVAERPMYFNSGGINSGTDVLGATNTTNTTFYFANGDSTQTTAVKSTEFLTIMNPDPANTAEITVNYYSGGQVVETDQLSVLPLHRGTSTPQHYHGKAAVQVTSTIGVVVERPMYLVNSSIPGFSSRISGAATTVGATTLGNDWLFAEGHTVAGNQENLILANFDTNPTTATIKLEYTNGTVQTIQKQVNAQSQLIFDVNYANAHPNCGANGNPACTVTPSVSAEVTATTSSLVVDRVMYFLAKASNGSITSMGMTDVVGEAGPSSHTTYSFAEGHAISGNYNWLSLQNPNNTSEVVAITLFADNTIVQEELTLLPHSRTTILMDNIVGPIFKAYPMAGTNNVAAIVQVFSGTVVVERPIYFHSGSNIGVTDLLGYIGG